MPSASAKGSTTSSRSMHTISRAPSPAWRMRMKPQPDLEATPAKPKAQAKAAVEPAPSVLLKLAIELGPLLVFFGTNAAAGIYTGTAAFMAATIVSLAVAWLSYHKVPIMPIVSGVVVLVFGG